MGKVFKIFLIYFFLNSNTFADAKVFQKKNDDGTRFFDIKFIFESKNTARKNFTLLTDYLKIHRFNPSVHKTEIISKEGKERTVLKTTFRNCIHFFCREMIMYESILSYCVKEDTLHCTVNAEVLPNKESPVYAGRTIWNIKENDNGKSKISYRSKFIADIFLPPVFGESIFKKTINRNLNHLEERINNFNY